MTKRYREMLDDFARECGASDRLLIEAHAYARALNPSTPKDISDCRLTEAGAKKFKMLVAFLALRRQMLNAVGVNSFDEQVTRN